MKTQSLPTNESQYYLGKENTGAASEVRDRGGIN